MPVPGQPDFIPDPPKGFDPSDYHWSPLGYITTKYVWNTWGDNCPICDAMRGKTYTLDMWMNIGIWPGFHLGCDCSMKKVSVEIPISDPDFFGMNIPQFADMWLPFPNLFWDPNFKIQPWQMSIVSDIERMHIQAGADTSIASLIKNLGGTGFFSHRPRFYGDTAGWRVLAAQRHFQDIDGSYSGSKLFTFSNVKHILEPFWLWFKDKFKTSSTYVPQKRYSVYNPNVKYSQMKRFDSPSFPKPVIPKPYMPYQSYYTEVKTYGRPCVGR